MNYGVAVKTDLHIPNHQMNLESWVPSNKVLEEVLEQIERALEAIDEHVFNGGVLKKGPLLELKLEVLLRTPSPD